MDPTPDKISGDGLLSNITAYPISGSLCARWTPRPERRCYVWDCGGLFSKERKGDSGACVGGILAVGVDALGGLPRPIGFKYPSKKTRTPTLMANPCRCGLPRGPPERAVVVVCNSTTDSLAVGAVAGRLYYSKKGASRTDQSQSQKK